MDASNHPQTPVHADVVDLAGTTPLDGSDVEISSQRNNIAKDGDVIIEMRDKVELRVSSAVLSNASRVSKGLFDASATDQQTTADADGTKRVTMMKVSRRAMQRLCRLLHGKKEDKDGRLQGEALVKAKVSAAAHELLDLAIIVQDYEFVESVAHSTGVLLARFSANLVKLGTTFEANADLIAAPVILKQRSAFTAFTRISVRDHHRPDQSLHYPRRVPSVALQEIGQQRCQAFLTLAREVSKLGSTRCSQDGCNETAFYTNTSVAFARRMRPPTTCWPPEMRSPYELRRILTRIRQMDGEGDIPSWAFCSQHRTAVSITRRLRAELVQMIFNVTSGLCLPCLNQKGRDDACEHKPAITEWFTKEIAR